MNLINIQFIKENLKKSKGIIILLLSIIPIINVLYLFKLFNKIDYIMDFHSLELITFLGSFIFSIVISYLLNKFLFKQKELDYYLSKPISRKKLYFTNLLTFIILIIILLLLNIIAIIALTQFTDIIITIPIIIDYFIYNLILYLFIYSVSCLSMYISPNFLASLVISTLIIFTYPFIIITDKLLTDNYTKVYTTVTDCDESYCEKDSDNYKYYIEHHKNINATLTLPSSYIVKEPMTKDIVKTTILCITYIALGLIAFNKRKCENTLKVNDKIHYTLKSILLIPLSFIIIYFLKDTNYLGVILSMIFILVIYTFYDILTKKSLYKPIKSIIIFTWTFIPFLIIASILMNFYNKEEEIKLTNLGYIYDEFSGNNIKTNIDKVNIDLTNKNDINYYPFYTKKYTLYLPLNQNNINEVEEKSKNDYLTFLNSFNLKEINYLEAFLEFKPIDKDILNDINIMFTMDNTFRNNVIGKGNFQAYIYKNFKYNQIDIPYDINDQVLKLVNEHTKKLFLNSIKNYDLIAVGLVEYNNTSSTDKLSCIIKSNKNSLIEYLINHVSDPISKDYKLLYYRTNNNSINTFKVNDNSLGAYVINDVEGFYNFIDSFKDCRQV